MTITLPYFQKGSPYIEEVNDKLLTLKDMSLIEKWVQETMVNASNCDSITKVVGSHGRKTKRLGLSQIGSFFMLVTGGLALSIFGLLGETTWHKYGRGTGKRRT